MNNSSCVFYEGNIMIGWAIMLCKY